MLLHCPLKIPKKIRIKKAAQKPLRYLISSAAVFFDSSPGYFNFPIPNKVGIIINKPKLAHGHFAGENEGIRVRDAYTVILKKEITHQLLFIEISEINSVKCGKVGFSFPWLSIYCRNTHIPFTR